MRYARQLSISMRWLAAALPLCAAIALGGCHGSVGAVGDAGSLGGNTGTGTGGMAPACTGMSDPRMVVADQRIMLMTKPQLVNTVRYLIDDAEADALLAMGGTYNLTPDTKRHFPPSESDGEQQD